MKQKFALFDFDNTLSQGDSIYHLLKYYVSKHPLTVFRFIKVGILYLGYKLKLCSFIPAKQALLFPLDKMSDKELEEFYINEVEPHYYLNVIEELKKRKEEGCIIVLCTASVECYMQYCRLPIDVLIGTKTKRVNNHNTSIITTKNCKKEEKVIRINEYLKEKNYEIDYDNSWGYSDSITDMPMLEMVKNRVRIELKTGKIGKW